MFSATLFKTVNIKQPKWPLMNKWIKKMWYIHITKYYLALKKEENSAICNNLDGPARYFPV